MYDIKYPSLIRMAVIQYRRNIYQQFEWRTMFACIVGHSLARNLVTKGK